MSPLLFVCLALLALILCPHHAEGNDDLLFRNLNITEETIALGQMRGYSDNDHQLALSQKRSYSNNDQEPDYQADAVLDWFAAMSSEQHGDFNYRTGYGRKMFPRDITQTQNIIDYHWMRVAHEYGLKHNPKLPYVGMIVNHTNNELLCVSVNMRTMGDAKWSRFDAHGERVALLNCTEQYLPDVYINGSLVANPGWADTTFYATIEPCPMCSQSIIVRSNYVKRRIVFGARARALRKRCWTASTLTLQEIVDHSEKQGYPGISVTGPLPFYEDTIVAGFTNRC